MEGNQINQLKSVLSEGDTADYIAQLLKGSGASINYDQLRDELGKVDGASSFAHTVSTINSISVDPTSISVHHPPSHTAQSANLEDFDEFLKVKISINWAFPCISVLLNSYWILAKYPQTFIF